jgi:hypothetical protein
MAYISQSNITQVRAVAERCAARGIKVVYVKGWETRGRARILTPVGSVFHHTAGSLRGGDKPSLTICTKGRQGLPGPLCNFFVSRSGVLYVIAAGSANHAGTGDRLSWIGRNRGNARTWGTEVENNGLGEPWSASLMAALRVIFGVQLQVLGQPSSRLVGHREYTSRKPDPAGVDLGAFRKSLTVWTVKDLEPKPKAKPKLAAKPTPEPPAPSKPKPVAKPAPKPPAPSKAKPVAKPAPQHRAAFPVLRQGSKGESVRAIQRFLGLRADGVFGPDTAAYVRRYQRMRGIPADGVVGPTTWAHTKLKVRSTTNV